ncbi:MAG: response regulator transcription factor [Anaerolineae bacterium]|nr:response regulator transcription factor [Anaerolineae bacterium]
MAIRVLVADDHPEFRAGLARELEQSEEMEVVGQAGDMEEALLLAEALRPEVLVLALSLPGPCGPELVGRPKGRLPSLGVLVMSASSDGASAKEMLQVGASRYLVKGEPVETVLEAIQAVAEGRMWLSGCLLAHGDEGGSESQHQEPALTRREEQLLDLMARGYDNAAIAAELCLARQTVRNYTSRVYAKLGVTNRYQAILWAREHGYRN